MSDCGACILSEADGYCDFCTVEVRKARKPHRCCECDKEIQIGERYEHARGKFDGDMWSSDTCLICAEIADAFYCNGRMYGGGLWEEMGYILDEITTVCFSRLKTAAAKEELQRRINERRLQ